MSGQHQTTQKLQQDTKEVTALMQINVQKVVQRGENLEKLQDKSEELQQNSLIFKKGAKQVEKHMWWKNQRLNLIIGGCAAVILVILIIIIVEATKKK